MSADIHLRGETTDAHLFVRISDPEGRTIIEQSFDRKSATEETVIHAELDLGNDARLWSDRDPFLYTIEVQLESDLGLDRVHDRFGLREFVAEGRHLLLNGERFFLRGYVDCCIFPLTGYPPESKETYARQFQIAREWGFNHVRLHSWVPSRVFFEAADEAGILVQCELPNWSNANDPAVVSRVGDFFRSELDNVVVHLQRHPSLVIHSMGNELLQQPPGGMKFRYSPFLNELIQRGKALDPARLFIDQSGFGDVPEEAERLSEVSVLHTFRGSTPDTTASWWPRSGGGAVPVIAHEHTQIDMYARFDEIEKFSGIMEPSWLLQAQASLARRGVLERADRYLAGSAAIQKRCLKELFERIRRTPELAGVQMLNFTDFPGQGTALNGVLDVFWDEKGHITADEFRQFFDETVLLCRTPHRTYRCGAGFRAEILVSHYGQESLTGELHWALTANDRVLAEGRVTVSNVPTGEPWPIGIACAGLPSHETCELTLSVAFKTGHRTITNSWNYWVFDTSRWDGPAGRTLVHRTLAPLSDVYSFLEPDTFGFLNGGPTSPEFGVIVSDVMQVRYVEAMYNGATLVYLAENDELQDGITSRFEPLFWSYLWFTNQPNQTMGLTIDRHPILGSFPHDGFSDWQWFHLVDGATAVGLDTLPGELEPVVGAIDNWNRGKRLGYVFEAKVGRGRFIMTTLKLLDQYPHRPEAVYLLDQLLRYAHKTEVEPGCELTLSDMWSIPKNPVRWAHP